MNAFTIKDIENLTGVKAHTIRIWEQRYNFLKPQRTGTNIRYYSNEELKIILNIALLNRFGFKISYIDKLGIAQIQAKLHELTHPQALHYRLINELITCMIDMDMDSFELILNKNINDYGIDRTIEELIFPFLEKVGLLWITNNINPAQEHLVTNLIRQKILVGIEQSENLFSENKSVLLFLPEGEHHELGLLYVYYLIKNKGIKVFYLGADVPYEDLAFLVDAKKPDYVYSHLTSVAHNFNLEKFILNLQQKIPQMNVVISGSPVQHYSKTIPAQFHLLRSLQEVKKFFL